MSSKTKIRLMGKFTAIGMRTPIPEHLTDALVISTCGRNDTNERGTPTSWAWCNPTNRVITHKYEDIEAVSVEALWQGTKLLPGMDKPDPEILAGSWRKHKGRKPAGAYAGPGQPLITTPGEARRRIYLPAYDRLVAHWNNDPEVRKWIEEAKAWIGLVFLRDHDTGRGVDRNGPLSHAWVLASWLNGTSLEDTPS